MPRTPDVITSSETMPQSRSEPGPREKAVFSVIGLFPSAKNRAQLIELLRSVLDLSRVCPGRLAGWVSEEDSLQNRIIYAEQWESEEALCEHIRSALYRRILSAIELSERTPEVRFYYANESRGFDLVESLRRKAA
jgi:quinol monooxygenase YgiN